MIMNSKAAIDYEDYIHEPNSRDLDHIPGNYGWPLVGHSIPYVRDPFAFAKKHAQKYGLLSRVNTTGTRALLALGPDLTQQVLLDKDRVFSSRTGYFDRVAQFFSGSLIMEDFDHHRHQRRIMQTAFKNESLRHYTGQINEIYARTLHRWTADVGSTITFFDHTKKLLLTVAAEIFLGEDEQQESVKKLNQAFVDCANGPAYLFPFALPGTALRKGLDGKEYLDEYFSKLVPIKREGDGLDMMSHFCRERDEEGNLFSPKEIADQTKFLMLAAHDTTTAAIVHTLYYLMRNPQAKERLYEECAALGKDALEYEDLSELPFMQNVFHEVLRLIPSAPTFPRRTIKETEMMGYRVPAHTMIYMLPRYNHHMPEYWSNPEAFDPDRFSPERAEHKQHPFIYYPFGGGAHKCIGMHFSQMEYKCFMYQFMRKFDFESRSKREPTIRTIPIPRPSDSLPVALIKR